MTQPNAEGHDLILPQSDNSLSRYEPNYLGAQKTADAGGMGNATGATSTYWN